MVGKTFFKAIRDKGCQLVRTERVRWSVNKIQAYIFEEGLPNVLVPLIMPDLRNVTAALSRFIRFMSQ